MVSGLPDQNKIHSVEVFVRFALKPVSKIRVSQKLLR